MNGYAVFDSDSNTFMGVGLLDYLAALDRVGELNAALKPEFDGRYMVAKVQILRPTPVVTYAPTADEVEDARQATEDVELVRTDGTLTEAGELYVADTRTGRNDAAPLSDWLKS